MSAFEELVFEIDEDDALLSLLLTGHVVAVHREEDMILLSYSDKKIFLICSAFGMVTEALPQC